ncbi:hypothetical protein RND71_013101 [Anisodus tanguticus]|uniref:Transcriptional regulator STERILE APETALA n=1 Tax=Anisodus tanguticus TaxID=243964 RepID=A0AAE1VQH5_9SOLA|nr:hypothetical protein RND71_013101 [Anisodus tanguticus]
MAVDAYRSIGRLAAAQALSNLFQMSKETVEASFLLILLQTKHIPRFTGSSADGPGLLSPEIVWRKPGSWISKNKKKNPAILLVGVVHLSTFHPQQRDRLGRYSRAVSGIILSDENVVFASLDGDIHVAVIGGAALPRRAHLGDVVNDGALVDFTGCDRWWVGLYAGVPGRAFHIWNSETEELMFVDGDLTDLEAVTGWHLLTELTELVGRVRVTTRDTAVACTGLRLVVIDLRNQGWILRERSFQQGLIVGSFDSTSESLMAVDGGGVAIVLRVEGLEESCRFNVRGASQRGVVGCMNDSGYGVMCVGGVIRVWDVENGVYLYSLRERLGEVNAMHADERHIVACSSDGTIHLWDFGAQ